MTLVTEQRYRTLTGDLRTPSETVTAALSRAQALVEERLGRELGVRTVTETLPVSRERHAFPTHTPIAGATPGYLDASRVLVDTWAVGLWSTFGTPSITLTYTGGYAPETLPESLATGISMLAQSMIEPTDSLAVAGATSVSQDGTSVSYRVAPDPVWPAGVWKLVRRYRPAQLVTT